MDQGGTVVSASKAKTILCAVLLAHDPLSHRTLFKLEWPCLSVKL